MAARLRPPWRGTGDSGRLLPFRLPFLLQRVARGTLSRNKGSAGIPKVGPLLLVFSIHKAFTTLLPMLTTMALRRHYTFLITAAALSSLPTPYIAALPSPSSPPKPRHLRPVPIRPMQRLQAHQAHHPKPVFPRSTQHFCAPRSPRPPSPSTRTTASPRPARPCCPSAATWCSTPPSCPATCWAFRSRSPRAARCPWSCSFCGR